MLALSAFFLVFGVINYCAAFYFSMEIEDKDKDCVRLARKLGRTIGDLDALIAEYDQAVNGHYNHPDTGKFVSREDFYKAVFNA